MTFQKKVTPIEIPLDQEPMVKIKFQHAENPGKDVEFSCEEKNRKFQGHLTDGEITELPVWVWRHLNSLKYPVHDYVNGKNQLVGERNRFNCIQIELLEPQTVKEVANG